MSGLLSMVGLSPIHSKKLKGPTFTNQLEFLLSIFGFSVGLGNIWQFPYFVYGNGNATFLIPYFIMIFFVSIPLLNLQLSIGQFSRLPCTAAYESLAPIFKGVGWAMVGSSVITIAWYGTMTSWVLYYTFKALETILSNNNDTLPWAECRKEWMIDMPDGQQCWDKHSINQYNSSNNGTLASQLFFHYALGSKSDGIQTHLIFSAAALYGFVFLCVGRGIKTSGKVVYFTAIYPYFILLLFLYPVSMTEGAGSGLYYFFKPQMSVLLKWETWSKAASHAIFSMGTAYGVHIMMASHSKFLNDVYRDCFLVAGANVVASLLSSLVIFQILGCLSYNMNRSIEEVVTSRPEMELPFIAFLSGLDLMAGYLHIDSSVWAFVFFSMVLFSAIDSLFGLVQNFASVLQHSFCKSDQLPEASTDPENNGETRLIFTICLLCFFGTLPLCFRNGIQIFRVLHESVSSYVLLPCVLLQLLLVTRVYGWKKFFADIELMLGYKYKMKPWIMTVHKNCKDTKCHVRQRSLCVHRIVMKKIEEGRSGDEEESKLGKLFGPTGHWIRFSLCYISPLICILCFIAAVMSNYSKHQSQPHSLIFAAMVFGFGLAMSGIKAISLAKSDDDHDQTLNMGWFKNWLKKLVKSDFDPHCELPRNWQSKDD